MRLALLSSRSRCTGLSSAPRRLAAVCLAFLTTLPVLSQVSPLDPSFGLGGQVMTNVGTGTEARGNAVAVQPDGRIVTAGTVYEGGALRFILTRHLPDGRPDLTFGNDGVVATGYPLSTAYAVALQPDGRIVAAGSGTGGVSIDFGLARYLPDGSLDASFGDAGFVTTDFGEDRSERAYAVAIQPDGKIVVAGNTFLSSNDSGVALARYRPDGSLDPAFGEGGLATFFFGQRGSEAHSVLVQADGKIVVAGVTEPVLFDEDFLVMRLLADGTPDTSFGGDGFVTTSFSPGDDGAGSVVVQPDGRLVVGGYARSRNEFALARYLPGGSLDFSFDDDGLVTTSVSDIYGAYIEALSLRPDGRIIATGNDRPLYAHVTAQYLPTGALDTSWGDEGLVSVSYGSKTFTAGDAALQTDGALVVAGNFSRGGSGSEQPALLLARLSPDGTLDPAFDGDGFASTEDVGTGPDEATAMALQPDGKIVVAGHAERRGVKDVVVVRYLPDGALDPSFGEGGHAWVPFTPANEEAHAVALQPDGKIIVAGFAEIGHSYRTDFAVARLLPNGQLDDSFGDDGRVTTDFAGEHDFGAAMALQTDGKIVVVGYTTVGGRRDIALARYLPDGDLDPTFSSDGRVTIDLGENDRAYAVALQPDGKIVVAGRGGPLEFAVTRHLPNGALDASFSEDGRLTTSFGTGISEAFGLAIQPDGKIVAVGAVAGSGAIYDFALARYLPDGNLDTGFGTGGRVTTDFAMSNDRAFSVALQPDGGILAAGSSDRGSGSTPYNSNFALARYRPNGSLHSASGDGGLVVTDFAGGRDAAYALSIQADGRIVAAGTGTHEGSSDFAVARYLPDLVVAAEPGPGVMEAALSVAPNPTRGPVTVRYTLRTPGYVRLTLYDVLGRRVASLEEGERNDGDHAVRLALPLTAGMYFVQLEVEGDVFARPLTITSPLR